MKKKSVLIVLLVMGAMLSACNFPLAFGDPEEVENAVAETLAAIEAAEEEVVVPTLALAPTSTPMPTEEPEEQDADTEDADADEEDAEAADVALCLSATAYDLTVPDDTKIAAGAKFDKAWTFKNVGYCAWESDYKLVFESGEQMSGPDSKEIGAKVAPNGEIDVNLVLYAPANAGTYRGNWMLQSDKGVDIGPVWVQIVVE
jgi:hypothetical protein